MKVLVTGGNQGIGFALCRQLVLEHQCHVLLTARSESKGMEAVSKIQREGGNTAKNNIEFIPLDTSNDESVQAAAEMTKSKLNANEKLGAIVNNAGIGLNTASSNDDILNTNLYGPKRVCDNFIPLLEEKGGRIINLGSGSGPMYVGGCSKKDQAMLCSPESMTWEQIEQHGKANVNRGVDAYGLSKALLAGYTGVLAQEYPDLWVSCCSPGFINTQMTSGWGASKGPEQGTLAIKKLLLDSLEGSGYYYGSDGIRSPYHFMRNPGEPAYDGINPFV